MKTRSGKAIEVPPTAAPAAILKMKNKRVMNTPTKSLSLEEFKSASSTAKKAILKMKSNVEDSMKPLSMEKEQLLDGSKSNGVSPKLNKNRNRHASRTSLNDGEEPMASTSAAATIKEMSSNWTPSRKVTRSSGRLAASPLDLRRNEIFQGSSSALHKLIFSFNIQHDANGTNPHWCLEVEGTKCLPFLSSIDSVKWFSEEYRDIRQVKRVGFKFIFVTNLAWHIGAHPPVELRDRLNQSFVDEVGLDENRKFSVSQILWTR